MRYKGFIGPSYTLDSKNIDAQRCVNFYPKMDESGQGKSGEVASLIGTPGLSTLATLSASPIRGIYTGSNGFLYVASGNKLYYVNSSWVARELGELSTSTGTVDFADNGSTLFIVDGPNGYWHTLSSGVITKVSNAAWLGSTTVNFIDGYFVFHDPATQKFYISGLNDITFDALDFSTADGAPDDIIAIQVNHREVWIFGSNSIETWYNSGNASFPFERTGSGFIETGLAAAFSVAKIDRITLWLGKNGLGEGIVYAAQGLVPQRISTHAIELAIQSYGDISDAVAYTYQENGHQFYVLNFTSAKTTWVFDLTTKLWHERAYLKDGEYTRHRANCHAFAYNTHVVGDWENGKIYDMNAETFYDDGQEIKRMRTAPHISEGVKRIKYKSFQLEAEVGTGLTTNVQGQDPKFLLQFSDDGGHTWSHEKKLSMGKLGERITRMIWRRLGIARSRVFRVISSEPVKTNIIGVELDAEAMRN